MAEYCLLSSDEKSETLHEVEVMVVDPLLTVGTVRRVPRVNNMDEVQTAAAGQHWTGALKHILSAHYKVIYFIPPLGAI